MLYDTPHPSQEHSSSWKPGPYLFCPRPPIGCAPCGQERGSERTYRGLCAGSLAGHAAGAISLNGLARLPSPSAFQSRGDHNLLASSPAPAPVAVSRHGSEPPPRQPAPLSSLPLNPLLSLPQRFSVSLFALCKTTRAMRVELRASRRSSSFRARVQIPSGQARDSAFLPYARLPSPPALGKHSAALFFLLAPCLPPLPLTFLL